MRVKPLSYWLRELDEDAAQNGKNLTKQIDWAQESIRKEKAAQPIQAGRVQQKGRLLRNGSFFAPGLLHDILELRGVEKCNYKSGRGWPDCPHEDQETVPCIVSD